MAFQNLQRKALASCPHRRLSLASRRSFALAVAALPKKGKSPTRSDRVIIDYDRVYMDASYLPERQMGPISLQNIPGKGRGLLSKSEVEVGDVLLVSEPIATVSGPQSILLGPEKLVSELKDKQLSPGDSYRLSLLYDGSESARPVASLEQLAGADAFMKKDAAKQAVLKKGFGSPRPAEGAASAGSSSNAERLEAVVRLNAQARRHMDLAAGPCRGEAPSSCIGLWPEVAMINHSCAPNALTVMVGDRMLVRATRTLRKAEEITLSYLAGLDMAPLKERRSYLEANFGFKCNCYRCRVEEAQAPEVQQALQAVHEWLAGGSMLIEARSVINAKDMIAVEKLKTLLQSRADELETVFTTHNVMNEVKPWLKTSVYGVYELLALCHDVGHETESMHPARLAPLLALIAPGSEAHLFLTLERLLRAGEESRTGPETEQAAKECILAHSLRYGKVSDPVLTRIMDVLGNTDFYMGRYDLSAS